MISTIGGYFQLECRQGKHFHKDALRLNTARNCFEYILRARKYTKVYVPYYTCDVMLEPLNKCNVQYEFYHINDRLEPTQVYALQPNEAFLYTNYFGLKQRCVKHLATQYGTHLIVDNAQAFYATPIDGIDTFYSPRKFFGVPDGAYLYTTAHLDEELPQDQSYQRMSHLLIRTDIGAEAGYQDFCNSEEMLIDNPIRRMSRLTETLLCGIDYETIRQKRCTNYRFLDSALGERNAMPFPLQDDSVPMVYPFYSEDDTLRQRLLDNKIYVATYWQSVLLRTQQDDLEYALPTHLLPIPIDQRYTPQNLQRLIFTITK